MYRILVVDDEKIERNGLISLIRKFDMPFEIFEAVNGRQAVQLLEREHIDVILTDIRMPIMDGLELIAWVRKHQPGIHVAINSAYGEFEYAQKAMGMNVREYVLKPVNIEQFKQTMQRLIDLCQEDCVREKQQNATEKALEENRKYKEKTALSQLLSTVSPHLLPQEAQAFYNQNFYGKWVTLVLAECHQSFFDVKGENFVKLLQKYAPTPFYLLIPAENQAVVFLYSEKPVEEHHTEELSRTLLSKVRQLYGTEMFFTVTSPVDTCAGIAKCWAELEISSEYKFFASEGNVVFSKCGYVTSTKIDIVLESLVNRINEDITYKEFSKAIHNIETLFNTLEKQKALSILYVKHLFAKLLTQAAQSGHSPMDGDAVTAMLKEVVGSANLYTLKEYVVEKMEVIAELNSGDAEQGAGSRAVEQAISIIRQEYAGNQINLDYLADRVYLSPSYFSSVFKAETGESLVKFLTRYRLERAQDMLLHTNNKVADIGKQVGFSSSSYFVTVYRNFFGISPSQYREQNK